MSICFIATVHSLESLALFSVTPFLISAIDLRSCADALTDRNIPIAIVSNAFGRMVKYVFFMGVSFILCFNIK